MLDVLDRNLPGPPNYSTTEITNNFRYFRNRSSFPLPLSFHPKLTPAAGLQILNRFPVHIQITSIKSNATGCFNGVRVEGVPNRQLAISLYYHHRLRKVSGHHTKPMCRQAPNRFRITSSKRKATTTRLWFYDYSPFSIVGPFIGHDTRQYRILAQKDDSKASSPERRHSGEQ